MGAKLLLAPAACKETALILDRLDLDDKRALHFGLDELHARTPARGRPISPAERTPSNNCYFRNGDDETTTLPPELGLLGQDFVGKVPGEQQHIRWQRFQQLLRRVDGQMRARREVSLLDRAAIYDELE